QEPMLLVLHIGYLWLVASLALLGLSALTPSHSAPSTALHALTAGAIGIMTLAVMTRASLGHTGREIKASRVTLAIYALVNIGALLRVAAALVPGGYLNILTLSGIVWSAAFGLFVLFLRSDATPAGRRSHLILLRLRAVDDFQGFRMSLTRIWLTELQTA